MRLHVCSVMTPLSTKVYNEGRRRWWEVLNHRPMFNGHYTFELTAHRERIDQLGESIITRISKATVDFSQFISTDFRFHFRLLEKHKITPDLSV